MQVSLYKRLACSASIWLRPLRWPILAWNKNFMMNIPYETGKEMNYSTDILHAKKNPSSQYTNVKIDSSFHLKTTLHIYFFYSIYALKQGDIFFKLKIPKKMKCVFGKLTLIWLKCFTNLFSLAFLLLGLPEAWIGLPNFLSTPKPESGCPTFEQKKPLEPVCWLCLLIANKCNFKVARTSF